MFNPEFETVVTHMIDDTEFDRIASAYLGRSVSFDIMQEAQNDTVHSYVVDGAGMGDYDLDRIREIADGERAPFFDARCILEALVYAGHLPAGRWIIKVSW